MTTAPDTCACGISPDPGIKPGGGCRCTLPRPWKTVWEEWPTIAKWMRGGVVSESKLMVELEDALTQLREDHA